MLINGKRRREKRNFWKALISGYRKTTVLIICSIFNNKKEKNKVPAYRLPRSRSPPPPVIKCRLVCINQIPLRSTTHTHYVYKKVSRSSYKIWVLEKIEKFWEMRVWEIRKRGMEWKSWLFCRYICMEKKKRDKERVKGESELSCLVGFLTFAFRPNSKEQFYSFSFLDFELATIISSFWTKKV